MAPTDAGDPAGDSGGVRRAWTRRAPDAVRPPLAVTLPYVEVKLEHPSLAATGFGDAFFPDAVPYALADEHRVFYWRPVLDGEQALDAAAVGACASTHGLRGLEPGTSSVPALVGREGDHSRVVVDGTVAGDSTTALVADYDPPHVAVAPAANGVTVTTPTGTRTVAPGSRVRRSLPEQRVRRPTLDGASADAAAAGDATTTVTPRLTVRHPGRRTLYHPAPGASYRLFPSFGLSLDALPNPVVVPTAHGELDAAALADAVGVSLAARPYPERVLWQAFAHTAFDPHRDAPPELVQFPNDTLAVLARS